jgi:PAS domain S-box-containing protein
VSGHTEVGTARPAADESEAAKGGLGTWLRSALPRGGTLPDDVWRSRHRGILTLLWLHLPALFVFAVARGNSWKHGLFEAGVVGLPAMAAQLSTDRRRESTIFASVGLMTASAVLVHLSGGVIEAHFHFFVMVGVVVLYQDWRPFLVAIAFVVLHHGVMGVLSPHDVYNHKDAWAHPWTWAGIHGVSILAMSVAGIASWKLNERSQSQLAALAAIVASSDDAIYGWTVDGTINSWNQGAVELYGYGHDEILGRSVAVLSAPDRAAEAGNVLDRVRRGGRIEAFDTERVRKDGSVVEVSVTMSAVRNPAGEVVGGATIARDITERRRADEALRASEDRTRRIIDTARDAFVGMDRAGLITDWNRAAEVAFGWSRDEAVGRPLAETVIPARDRRPNDTGLARYLATGDGPVVDGRVEGSGLHRDGHEFPMEVAVWRVGTGAAQHFSAFIRDITERKRDEHALQQTLSLLGATLESTADGILVVDPHGRMSSYNGKFAEMWRLPASVLESRDDGAAVAFVLDQLQDPDAFIAKVNELYGQPLAESHDTLHFKDGREFERSSKPLRVGGAVVGRVWSFHDVSDRKRLEAELADARDKALESSRLKSEFLATMSHEIRTPMNGVIGLTGLLLETGLTDTQRQYADGVRASGEALLGIINDILDFSKIEAGKLELEMVDFHLGQALDEVVGLVAGTARAKGLDLVARCLPDVPTMVRGDVGRLRQILLNLVSNAVKFTAAGEVVVRASLGGAAGEDQVVVHLEVADTGIGIAPETAERLFEPFSQADASTTRRYGGTGLGLAICRRLAEAMGGSIGLDSRLGHGSTFWIDLPLGLDARSPTTPHPRERSLHGVRALVVDDSQTTGLVLAAQLRPWGVTADVVPDPYAALVHLRDAAASRPYDLALVDMDMGLAGVDGLELGRMVSADATLASLRLVLLSSVTVEAEAAARAGFSACLPRPVALSQLYDALLRAVTAPAQAAPGGGPAPPTATAPSKGRLLVVEDNAVNQVVAKGLVAKLGYGCDVAGNGIEALEALERQHYDAVFMDCQMPEMDGFEATAQIRRREAGTRSVPIIAMTAGALAEDRERCLAAGMDDYVSKPVTRRDLDRVLRQWLPAGGTAAAGDPGEPGEPRRAVPSQGAA